VLCVCVHCLYVLIVLCVPNIYLSCAINATHAQLHFVAVTASSCDIPNVQTCTLRGHDVELSTRHVHFSQWECHTSWLCVQLLVCVVSCCLHCCRPRCFYLHCPEGGVVRKARGQCREGDGRRWDFATHVRGWKVSTWTTIV
jgi:hypothetical protein